MNPQEYAYELGKTANSIKRKLASISTEVKNNLLKRTSELLKERANELSEANKKDLELARQWPFAGEPA